jgi:hypothetical protein
MHNDKQAVPEALAKIEKALKTVAGLADGSIEFTMRVPAVPDQDTDLILADALLTPFSVQRNQYKAGRQRK